MRWLILFVLLSACSYDVPALSLRPQLSYTPTLDVAGTLNYVSNDIEISGVVGQFKLVLTNTSDQPVTNTVLVVTVNDADRISEASLARIYREIYWGGSIFDQPTPIKLPSGEAMANNFNGTYAVINGDDLPPHIAVSFDSIVIAYTGLQLHFSTYASLPNGKYALGNGEEVTIFFKE